MLSSLYKNLRLTRLMAGGGAGHLQNAWHDSPFLDFSFLNLQTEEPPTICFTAEVPPTI